MPSFDGSTFDFLGIVAVFALVAANGFFVAAAGWLNWSRRGV